MGKRGPRPEPRTISLAKGSWRAKKRPGEPTEVSGPMTSPEWLTGTVALAVWKATESVLIARGCSSPAYNAFLACFAQAHLDLVDALAIIASEGSILTGGAGGSYLHPAVNLRNRAVETIAKFGREFGLSPTSIRDIQATSKPADAHGDKRRKFFG